MGDPIDGSDTILGFYALLGLVHVYKLMVGSIDWLWYHIGFFIGPYHPYKTDLLADGCHSL